MRSPLFSIYRAGWKELAYPADVVRSTDIALNNEPIGSKPEYLGKRIVGGSFIAAVVDCYLDALFRQLQRDPSAYASRASSNWCVFSFEWHRDLRFD
jgi:hypothetical protein